MKLIPAEIAILTVTLFALSLPAYSEETMRYDLSGKFLLSTCKQAISAQDANQPYSKQAVYCMGFIDGLTSGSLMTSVLLTTKKYSHFPDEATLVEQYSKEYGVVCMTNDIPRIDIIRVVVRYLETHRSELNKYSSLLAIKALQEEWPCESKTK